MAPSNQDSVQDSVKAPSIPATASPQTTAPDEEGVEPAFGWTAYAELINGRFAMIGFVALLIVEVLTHQSFWSWLGLQ